jgi:hypothetical protein
LLWFAGCEKPVPPRASEAAPANDAAASGDLRAVATPPPPPAAPTASSAAKPSAFHPDDDPACADLARVTSAIEASRGRANPQPYSRNARALWPTLSPGCRGATFFLAAAQIVGHAQGVTLSTPDGVVAVHSSADALAQGLAAEPDHPRLLAHLAFADDLDPSQAPVLPDGACISAKARGGNWTDYAAYVCALAAIHAGDGPAALAEIKSIRDAGLFPDFDARRAQALALVGKRKEARALVKHAVAEVARASRFDITAATIAALKKRLTAI